MQQRIIRAALLTHNILAAKKTNSSQLDQIRLFPPETNVSLISNERRKSGESEKNGDGVGKEVKTSLKRQRKGKRIR